jgi:hypothetical protein
MGALLGLPVRTPSNGHETLFLQSERVALQQGADLKAQVLALLVAI